MEPVLTIVGVAVASLGGLVAWALSKGDAAAVATLPSESDQWKAFAERNGLRHEKVLMLGEHCEGERDGLHVSMPSRFANREGGDLHDLVVTFQTPLATRLRVAPETAFDLVALSAGGQDMRLGDPAFDADYRVQGTPEERVRELLNRPRLRAAMQALRDRGWAFTLTGDMAHLHNISVVLPVADAFLEAGLELARAAREADAQPWLEAAGELGLSASGWGLDQVLEGVLDDVPIRVSLGETDGIRTLVTAPTPSGLPAGLQIVAAGPGRTGNVDLANPVLDRLLAITCDDPDSARQLLDREELTGALLEVVHGHPGSWIDADCVVLVVPGVVRELGEAVRAVVTLARTLPGA